MWAAVDAVVLKALAIVFTDLWASEFVPECCHVVGGGGAKAAIRKIRAAVTSDPQAHVVKSDIADYYGSIDHTILYAQLTELIDDEGILGLIWQFLRRTRCYGGTFTAVSKGISQSSPLSPFLGALYLRSLDTALSGINGVTYIRFMDDFVAVTNSRWKLRRCIKVMYRVLDGLALRIASSKTYIGRVANGFDFLGYRIHPDKISLSKAAIANLVAGIKTRFYEHHSPQAVSDYLQRWKKWATSRLTIENTTTRVVHSAKPPSSACRS